MTMCSADDVLDDECGQHETEYGRDVYHGAVGVGLVEHALLGGVGVAVPAVLQQFVAEHALELALWKALLLLEPVA